MYEAAHVSITIHYFINLFFAKQHNLANKMKEHLF